MSNTTMSSHAAEYFPGNSFFARLLKAAQKHKGIIIDDVSHGVSADSSRLLHDVVAFRNTIREQLPSEILDEYGIIRDANIYICILAPSSYEWLVAFLSILTIGAAAAPLAAGVLPEEALYFLNKCNAALLVAGTGQTESAINIQNYIKAEKGNDLKMATIDVSSGANPSRVSPSVILGSELPPDRPSLLLFTSGTTSAPKGVIHSLSMLRTRIDRYSVSDELFLNHASSHWGWSVHASVDMALNGIPQRILSPGSNPEIIWEVLGEGKVTILNGSPFFWSRLIRYFNDTISKLPTKEQKRYIDGVKALRAAFCSGSMPSVSMKKFWKEMRGGRPLIIFYGTTEVGGISITNPGEDDINERSVGKPFPGVELKLSEGDHGEVLVKNPWSFLGYINDEAATRDAFDEEGFYKTGDLSHLHNGSYIIDGRSKTDFISKRGVKIWILELEGELLELPYISEAYVLPVRDVEIYHHVAALVRFQPPAVNSALNGSTPQSPKELTLQALRADLSAMQVARYKLPTLLRVLDEGEEVPRTNSEKIKRDDVVNMYFPQSDDWKVEDLPEKVQVWDLQKDESEPKVVRSWDWSGLQDEAQA